MVSVRWGKYWRFPFHTQPRLPEVWKEESKIIIAVSLCKWREITWPHWYSKAAKVSWYDTNFTLDTAPSFHSLSKKPQHPLAASPFYFSPCLFNFLLQDQLQLNCGLCNSIDLQICLESILILFKGQSIESSLGLSEMNFIFHPLYKVEGRNVLLFKDITS